MSLKLGILFDRYALLRWLVMAYWGDCDRKYPMPNKFPSEQILQPTQGEATVLEPNCVVLLRLNSF
ncbi:MAG: hypothetical protein WA902_05595 [Thermosynechococcaceae cyanobacterium]